MVESFFDWMDSLTAVWEVVVWFSLLALLVLFIMFLIYLFSPKPYGDPFFIYGHLEEKSYTPEIESTGYGVGTQGGIITTSTSEESFNVVFETDKGAIITADDKQAYAKFDEGDRVKIWMQPRRLFGFEKSPQYYAAEPA